MSRLMFRPLKASKIFLCFLLLLTSFSCAQGKIDPFDTQNGLSRSEIKDSLVKTPKRNSSKKEDSSKDEAPIPIISKLIMTPPPPVIGGSKTISFSVTDQVPLKDVLIELGRVAQIDVDLDSGISGGIILNAKNRPLKEVIDRIASLGKLRYTYENGVLHFERDAPYMKNYFVDYLIDGSLWGDVQTNITNILSNSSGASGSTSEASSGASSISLNKSAGIISAFATDKEHEAIASYLADVEETASAQVLIEAKIVEVALSDVFKAGINWSSLGNKIASVGGSTATTGGIVTSAISIFNGNISGSVDALSTFGVTRTIASPRINAINNQKASLNFGDTIVYFKIDANQNVTTTSGATPVTTGSITSTKQELDVGTRLEITPSINIKTGEILMKVKPTLSIRGKDVIDPASSTQTFTDANGQRVALTNAVPQVNTRTMETIAKIKSGNVLVIGGLMKDTTANSDNGVPFLSAIPVLGWFFKTTSKDSAITETVILIKATIIKSNDPINRSDRDIQEKFDTNRRAFFGR